MVVAYLAHYIYDYLLKRENSYKKSFEEPLLSPFENAH